LLVESTGDKNSILTIAFDKNEIKSYKLGVFVDSSIEKLANLIIKYY